MDSILPVRVVIAAAAPAAVEKFRLDDPATPAVAVPAEKPAELGTAVPTVPPLVDSTTNAPETTLAFKFDENSESAFRAAANCVTFANVPAAPKFAEVTVVLEESAFATVNVCTPVTSAAFASLNANVVRAGVLAKEVATALTSARLMLMVSPLFAPI